MAGVPLDLQLLNLCAALLLLLSFAMLAQRRIVNLVNLLAVQGACCSSRRCSSPGARGEAHLYLSAALTLGLKVVLLPWLLHRLIRRLEVYWDAEPLLNISGTMLVGVLSSSLPLVSPSRFPRSRAPRRATPLASPSPWCCSPSSP